MNFFSAKSLAFYGSTIAFVITLFSLSTSYGETNLKAPTKIAGRYRLKAENLPGCLKAETLILTIDQSGIYLNGSLISETDDAQTAAAKKQPSLMGVWQQQLELSGALSHLDKCQSIVPTPVVKIQGTVNQATLKGVIQLASLSPSVEFVAQREDEPKQSTTSNH
jgi:hypothetical protein